jgi:CRISPR/Cas system-associated exonuclease Cas4 (RecB family)
VSESLVTASEVHEYFYCPYAWWFAGQEVAPERQEQLNRGIEYHEAVQRSSATPGRFGGWFIAAAFLLSAAALLLYLARGW